MLIRPALFLGLLAGVAAAQNHRTPFTGTWDFNSERSVFHPGPPFKSFTLIFTSDGVRHLDLVQANGQPLKVDLPWSDGKEVVVVVKEGFLPNVKAISKIRDRKVNDTWTQGGKVIEEVRGELSRDGKTLTMTVEGPLPSGGTFHNRVVFDRRKLAEASALSTCGISVPHRREGQDIKEKKANMSNFTTEEIQSVSPALERYRRDRIVGDLWKRPGLSVRDRSIVTVAVLIARNQPIEMPNHFNFALDNGVKPGELSEIITHLAFYSGWGNAMTGVSVANDVFRERGITVAQLPAATGESLPLDEAAEAKRAAGVQQNFGSVAPGVVEYTTSILFRDLWLRPALAPRDRSLVTVSALIAAGQVAQVTFHLNRAMDNGLTKEQTSEVLTQLAFYAGWPSVFSAMPVVKEVFEARTP